MTEFKPCPSCGAEGSFSQYMRRYLFQCSECFGVFKQSVLEKPKKRTRASHKAKAQVRRSRKNENKRARSIGGKVTPGSGNRELPSLKGDVVVENVLREEDKETEAKSFVLKASELEKIQIEARANGELMAFRVTFLGGRKPKSYVLVTEDVFDTFIDLWRADADQDD